MTGGSVPRRRPKAPCRYVGAAGPDDGCADVGTRMPRLAVYGDSRTRDPHGGLGLVHDSQRGSGTVLALVVLMSGVLLLSVVMLAADLLAASSQAVSAADMAALGAASARLEGVAEPCSVARAVIDDYGVRMTGCRLVGEDVVVTVTASPGLDALPDVERSSRAGPWECG